MGLCVEHMHTQISETVDSAPPFTSLSAPRGRLPLCTSLAPTTVYFQQLGFGLYRPALSSQNLPVCAHSLPAQIHADLGRE